MDYRETVHLPKTDFPMRAALSEREPAQVKAWEDEKVYEKLLAKNAAAEKFVFHDGPPYANGPIHQGHFLNKILKDLVVKYHLMAGRLGDFVPGWDCHGLPIERQVDKQLGAKKRELSVGEFRRACRKYAEEQIDLQRKDFKRLGILARWDHPYKTMDFRYEADIVRELSQFARRGALYRRKRPVHWCPVDVTALAEAEVEYADRTSPSIYVRFPVTAGGPQGWGLAIWTTTPWTIPANLAITANPELEYVADDFNMGVQYGLPIWAPVDGHGRFTGDVGIAGLEGLKVFDANPKVIELLAGAGVLLNAGGRAAQIRHSYPHCWRCKNPVIFRATDQWWIGLDIEIDLPGRGHTTIRKAALAAIDEIDAQGGWIPAWGKERIRSMVEGRPDWCVSRQRAWGVPIPVFYCARDREPLVSGEAVDHVARIFDEEGADAWFDGTARDLLAPETRCAKCGGAEFEKETDILDVWFDSGSSFAAVLERGVWPTLRLPADLYLEGSDQHRGWFMSALMIGIGTRGQAPYRAVLTHGFLVDGEGRKMSKSLGNAPDPQGLLKKYGAELMRLWVAGSDYRDDIGFSNAIVETLSESYRKIRNTVRYCLSQLYDFDPQQDSISELQPIDRWALSRFERYRAAVIEAYDKYEFHKVYRATVELCAVDLSAFYFDVLKDRTYCSGKRWPERRSAQTVLYRILHDR